MRFELSGIEAHTIECEGSVPLAAASACVPDALAVRSWDERAEVSLLCFAMRGLGASAPVRVGPRFDYGEGLWRIGVTWRDAPAWFALTCDLDRAAVRMLGAWLVRYPVRTAEVFVDDARASVRCESARLDVSARALADVPEPVPPRPLLVARDGELYRIPWREDPAPYRRTAAITVDIDELSRGTLGAAVQWSPHGLVHRGRTHRCGLATRI
jgi:hypothetical protein